MIPANGQTTLGSLPASIVPDDLRSRAPTQTEVVQQLLTFLGYTPGPADGVVGPVTQAALRAFQIQQGLSPTGVIDDAVMERFKGVRLMAAAQAMAPPLRKIGDDDAALSRAREAYGRGDYEAAHRDWLGQARRGNAEAQYWMGMLYDCGHGVAQDANRATLWYRRAADQDHGRAQTNLGAMYARGEGVIRDYSTACAWLERAASQGVARAQYNLGLMFANGEGVDISPVHAYKWFTLAADQGNAAARKARSALVSAMTMSEIVDGKRLAKEWTSAWHRRAGR